MVSIRFLVLAVLSTLTFAGCATPLVYSKWKNERNVDSVEVQTRVVPPSTVEVAWQGHVPESRAKGVLHADSMAGCQDVDVIVMQPGPMKLEPGEMYVLHVPATGFSPNQYAKSLWKTIPDGECTALLVAARQRLSSTGSLLLSTTRAGVTEVVLTEPRNPVWLLVLPVALVADTIAVAILVPVLFCSSLQDTSCLELLGANLP